MPSLSYLEGILLCVLGILVIVLVVLFVRAKIMIKVLREGKMDLESELQEKKKTISFVEKTIPLELYQEVIKEKGGNMELIPTYLPFAVMDMNTDDFNERIRAMQAKDIFEFINQMMMKTVPIVNEKKGIIDKFSRAGFTAFFEQSCEEALNVAVSISEIISREAQQSSMFEHFSVGISYGNVLAGLAGTESRLSLMTVSEYTGISSYLQSIGRKYNARILVTGTFCKRIEGFEQKFNARKVGYIYITATKSLEEIYDIFDGDILKIRNHKRKTKILFEKAVAFYAKGDYEKARQYFIEVFKTNRYDLAANVYLQYCDTNIARQQSGGKDRERFKPQIETF